MDITIIDTPTLGIDCVLELARDKGVTITPETV